jgi:hypothetical protein
VRRAVAISLLLVACGAKTGLRIPRYDASVDAGTDTNDDAWICPVDRGPVTPETAELMLVLDRSNSMAFTLDGTMGQPQSEWRWTIMQTAVDMALGSLSPRVHVGAKFFPDVPSGPPSTLQACTVTGPADVSPGQPNAASTIISIFANTLPSGGTPTAPALTVAAGAFSPRATRRFLLLATDGAPNCNGMLPQLTCRCTSPAMVCMSPDPGPYSCLDDTRTIMVLDGLLTNEQIPTYVVGIEDPGFSDVLDAMAVAGGRPRMIPGQHAFYSVTSAGELQQALMDITQRIPACIFSAPVPPPNARFSIEIDGTTIAQDTTNGWTWLDPSMGQIELHGAACARVTDSTRVEYVADTCPR